MIVVMSLSTVCKSPDKVRSSIKPILTDECSFSIGGGVLPHRTPMTPRDLLAVQLHWKGSRDCQMLRLAHMRMQSRQADVELLLLLNSPDPAIF